jgi:hypothetical protein
MDYLASPSLTAVNFSIRVTGLAMTDASAIRLSWINGSHFGSLENLRYLRRYILASGRWSAHDPYNADEVLSKNTTSSVVAV